MAEALARSFFSEHQFLSAGIEKHGLNPHAMKALEKRGIDTSKLKSKTIDEIDLKDLDILLSVCSHADQTCPNLDGNFRKIHRGFDDPPKLAQGVDDPLERERIYQRVCDQIAEYLSTEFSKELS